MAEDLPDGSTGLDDIDTSAVVLRKPKSSKPPVPSFCRDEVDGRLDALARAKEGTKRVKWSDSTNLREKMKEYRRSQLMIDLDYQHIAEEEEREKEGVKQWRHHLRDSATLDNAAPTSPDMTDGPASCGITEEEGAEDGVADGGNEGEKEEEEEEEEDEDDDSCGYSSDDDDFCYDQALEKRLRCIKAETTKFTVLPAYTAAVPVYEKWLANADNTSSLSDGQLTTMTSQLSCYRQALSLYAEWGSQTDPDIVDNLFTSISNRLQEARDLGPPPDCVLKAISEILNDPARVQQQAEVYNTMVDEMVVAFTEAVNV